MKSCNQVCFNVMNLLPFLSVGITDMYHHPWQKIMFSIKCFILRRALTLTLLYLWVKESYYVAQANSKLWSSCLSLPTFVCAIRPG